jgi:hypothetical protein
MDVTGDAKAFLASIGYQCDIRRRDAHGGRRFMFDFIKKGRVFEYDNQVRVLISRIYQLRVPGDVKSAVPLSPEYWLVEAYTEPVQHDQVIPSSEALQAISTFLSGCGCWMRS